jgi:hypothetical protein
MQRPLDGIHEPRAAEALTSVWLRRPRII